MSHRAMNKYICVHKSDKYTMLRYVMIMSMVHAVSHSDSLDFFQLRLFLVALTKTICATVRGIFVKAPLKSIERDSPLRQRQAVHIPLYPCI